MSELDAQGHQWRDGLRYPWPQAPASGQVQEVAEGVLWLRMPLPFGLDHINLYLLRHGDGWVAVDTGLNSDQCRAVWEQVFVEAMAGLPSRRSFAPIFTVTTPVWWAGWPSDFVARC